MSSVHKYLLLSTTNVLPILMINILVLLPFIQILVFAIQLYNNLEIEMTGLRRILYGHFAIILCQYLIWTRMELIYL